MINCIFTEELVCSISAQAQAKNQQEREKEMVLLLILDGTEGRSWLSWQLTCSFIFSTFSFSILRMHCRESSEWEMLEWSHVQFSIRVVQCSCRLWKFRERKNLPFWGPWKYLKIEQFNWSLWECEFWHLIVKQESQWYLDLENI